MFYATNEYDADKGVYKPAKEGTLGIVYLYRITTPLGQTSELSTLGVQIFPRTMNTKQFSYVLGPGEEFNEKVMSSVLRLFKIMRLLSIIWICLTAARNCCQQMISLLLNGTQ